MKQIIYVASTPGRIDFLTNFLQSVKNYDGKYPIFIESCYHYGWFDFATDHEYDEILFLHDSVEIKDYSLFDLVFDTYRGLSVSFTDKPYFIMGLGKFLRKPYLESSFYTNNAYEDYGPHEFSFGPDYVKHDGGRIPVVLFPDFLEEEQMQHGKRPRYERKFNRLNLVMENKYIKKYKGHWTANMIKNVDKNGYQIIGGI